MNDAKSPKTPARKPSPPEPWLRGTKTEVPAVPRAVLHALELAHEDLQKWCGELTSQELNARPAGLPPVAFHLRHISRSLDRLLTYAEGHRLAEDQLAKLKTEMEPGATHDNLRNSTQQSKRVQTGSALSQQPIWSNQERSVPRPCPPPSAACSSTSPTTPSVTWAKQ